MPRRGLFRRDTGKSCSRESVAGAQELHRLGMIVITPRRKAQPLLDIARPLALIVILFWLFNGESAQAAGFEPLPEIHAAALKHAQTVVPAGAELSAGRFDDRLRLAACPEPLATRTASDRPSALSVEVRCDALGWKLFVPVSVSVQVPVLVATRALARGQSVSAADVEIQQRERNRMGTAWLSSPSELSGRVLSRPVAIGTVLSSAVLAPAHLIKRGQSVMLIGESGGFQVRAEGKALDDAGAGESLRVQNLSSRRVVQGQVHADGTVRVSL